VKIKDRINSCISAATGDPGQSPLLEEHKLSEELLTELNVFLLSIRLCSLGMVRTSWNERKLRHLKILSCTI